MSSFRVTVAGCNPLVKALSLMFRENEFNEISGALLLKEID